MQLSTDLSFWFGPWRGSRNPLPITLQLFRIDSPMNFLRV